jgi:hypothetical protein
VHYGNSEAADDGQQNHASKGAVSSGQGTEQAYNRTQNQPEMQKQRPALVGSQMADHRLNAIARQIHYGHDNPAHRQAQRKFGTDRREDGGQHTREYIDKEMN